MRIALTGIGIIGAGLFIDWIAGAYGAVTFAFFGLWALLLTLSAAFAQGSPLTPDEALADEPAEGGDRVTDGS
ncbi:hypothetical protein NE236_32880 [Actinoallomurus purpureus]|jgi:hypothetical protein|uniref:hypothetical protein n=1 Tax=Actinoallomurus purpureus TaxID=478114 RepID=UPI0020921F5A|nr:hypothetical protein [Actinoallomurus purpureus]MCO6009777.1 hypothetical protein [Actinoallomurus purpureus]